MRALAPEPPPRSFWAAYVDWMLPTYLEFTVLIYFAILGLVYARLSTVRERNRPCLAARGRARARATRGAAGSAPTPFPVQHSARHLLAHGRGRARRAPNDRPPRRPSQDHARHQGPAGGHAPARARNLQLYLDIERERFSDRLRVEMEVHPDVLEARPESCSPAPGRERHRHGIAPLHQGGRIVVSAARSENRLVLSVADDGAGAGAGAATEGVGLRNTRASSPPLPAVP